MRVWISPRAERDLEAIGDYIADDNPARAVSFVAELRDQCAAIATAPRAFRMRPELGEGVRSCACGNYVIFFTVAKIRLIMWTFLKRELTYSTRFSEFIRTASSGEKKRVYTKVMKRASKLQNAVLSRHARPAKER